MSNSQEASKDVNGENQTSEPLERPSTPVHTRKNNNLGIGFAHRHQQRRESQINMGVSDWVSGPLGYVLCWGKPEENPAINAREIGTSAV